MGYREPQTPGIGGLNELTGAELADIQSIAANTFFRDNIEPSGTINGSNATFTLPSTPNPAASLQVFLNGFLQVGAGKDYSLSTATITFGEAPASGSIIRCWYRTEP